MNSNNGNIKTDKFDTIITLEKYNNLENKFKKLEDELKLLKLENISLKKEFNFNQLELDDYNKFEEKLKKGEIQMSENMQKIIDNHFNQKKEEIKDDSMDNNYIESSMKEDENNKITEKNEEENESNEEESELNYYEGKDNIINKATQNKAVINTRKQLERITKLYEELEKRLKKIKNAIKNIFSTLEIQDKEKEKEINKLFEICGFTEEEINEMQLYME